MRRLLGVAAALFTGYGLLDRPSADWTQWGGPRRDFSVEASPRLALPCGSVWSRPLGEGFSGVVVQGDLLVTMYRKDGAEHVAGLSSGDGATRWDAAEPAPFSREHSMEHGEGPHATPLIAGGRVFAVGATGLLRALEAKTGRLLWRRDLTAGLGGFIRVNGYASSPLAVDDSVVLPVGGRAGALVAFDQGSGEIRWQSAPDRIAPSSPILIDLDGERQIVAFLYDRIAGFDPRSGRERWSHAHVTDYGLNVATPIWLPASRTLVVSSAYNGGTRALELTPRPAGTVVRERWFTNRLRSHVGPVLAVGDLLIGSNGDLGPAPLTALDAATGEVVWRSRGIARATGLRVGADRVLLLEEDGELVLAAVTRSGIAEQGRVQVTTGTAWTVPTLVGDRLYVRDRRDVKAFAVR